MTICNTYHQNIKTIRYNQPFGSIVGVGQTINANRSTIAAHQTPNHGTYQQRLETIIPSYHDTMIPSYHHCGKMTICNTYHHNIKTISHSQPFGSIIGVSQSINANRSKTAAHQTPNHGTENQSLETIIPS